MSAGHQQGAAFQELLAYLGGEELVEAAPAPTPEPMPTAPDLDREEVAHQWETVIGSELLGPADRAKVERMAPVVEAYLSGQVERDEYERRLAQTAPEAQPDLAHGHHSGHGMPPLPDEGGTGEPGEGSPPAAGGDRDAPGRASPQPPAS